MRMECIATGRALDATALAVGVERVRWETDDSLRARATASIQSLGELPAPVTAPPWWARARSWLGSCVVVVAFVVGVMDAPPADPVITCARPWAG